jgi:hypothetical protein
MIRELELSARRYHDHYLSCHSIATEPRRKPVTGEGPVVLRYPGKNRLATESTQWCRETTSEDSHSAHTTVETTS